MSFVYYRLPHTDKAFRNKLDNEPEEFYSLTELNGKRGFVIAPFYADKDCPILLLDAEWEEMCLNDDCSTEARLVNADFEDDMLHYGIDFENYHAQLRDGVFSKIVLARSSRLVATENISPLTLFKRACHKYPRMFVALFDTQRSGTWLIATPEILVSGNGSDMQTMALAGTMRLKGEALGFDVEGSGIGKDYIHWSTKNIQEQRYVETYITECVEHFTNDFSVEGPYTSRAGDLVHLRSDIRFRLDDTSHLGDLLQALHPTPAVCGIPKESTQLFIRHNESKPRLYYSGFSGLIDPCANTNLFVTLRCMRIDTDECSTLTHNSAQSYTLYAGGGLLKDSQCQTEWEETEAKMNTMRQTFRN